LFAKQSLDAMQAKRHRGGMTDLAGTTFVLVHGAWHGGWCWRDVADRLRARGASVFTPTMTGLGERKHLREACKGLSTFIDDIIGVIEAEALSDIILVGHSFGGMAISGVADRLPDRIRHLVYLDACVPQDGQSLITQNIVNAAEDNEVQQQMREGMADIWVPPASLGILGLDDAPQEIKAMELAGMTDHPMSSFVERLHFINGGPKTPSTYIVCDDPPMPGTSFVAHYERVIAGDYGPHWTHRRIVTSHMAMLTAPEETVALLAEAALR
jgi:pimeloyl-ACP methyl ester carboxylesterase